MSGIPPADPDSLDVTLAWIALALSTLETAGPGLVVSYDAATQTANIQPAVRTSVLQPDGTYAMEDPAVIASVMVLFFRLGPFAVTAPVNPGDTVLLIRCSADIGPWRAGGGALTSPGDLRRHHNAHAIAIPGFYTRTQALAHFSGNLRIGLDSSDGSGTVEINSGGDVILGGGSASVGRVGDQVQVTIPVGTVIVSVTPGPPAAGVPNAAPITLTGTITAGATKVLA